MKSDKKDKKLMVVYEGKKIYFGSSSHSDYLIHKDDLRRERYRMRHKNDNIHDPSYAGFWSYWVLWGPYKTLEENLTFLRKKPYHLYIINKVDKYP